MAVVTLTGHLGSMGTIAARVADALGYALADRELLVEASRALGWSTEEVAEFDERTQGRGSRLTRLLRDFIEHAPMAEADIDGFGPLVTSSYAETAGDAMLPRDERYIQVLAALIGSLASGGKVVIVGRGAQALLAQEDAVHVRVVCELSERIRRVASRDGMTEQAARARIEDSDRQRQAWHQKYFAIDYESPYLYDLVLNSGSLSDEDAASLVVQLVHSAEGDGGRTQGPARADMAPAATPRARGQARQDWGWVELIVPASGLTAARAHLFALPLRGHEDWQGQIESLHLAEGQSALASGLYLARFGRGRDDRLVEVEQGDQGLIVRSTDAEPPAVSRERAEG